MTTDAKVKVNLITVPEAAKRLACSRSHVYDLVAAGKLRRYNVSLKGTKLRLSDEDVDRYIREAEMEPVNGAA
jgi:excisionase family DNA binding protein